MLDSIRCVGYTFHWLVLNIGLKACQSSERYCDISLSTNGFSSNENPKTVQAVELKI